MGFAGYFDVTLYNDVFLRWGNLFHLSVFSIVPGNHSKAMISWFPALIPLRQMLRLRPGTKYEFHISRKSDDNGVWYSWNIEYQVSLQHLDRYYQKFQ